jgi:small-conductance mechanosensitive channel
LEIAGIRLVGINAESGGKLLLSLACIVVVLVFGKLLRFLVRKMLAPFANVRVLFWTRQAINLSMAFIAIVLIVSIWFDDPVRLSTALGLVTAGLAFALQKVVTSLAGYFVILRGTIFNVGDRIRMGGVRGDVIALGFTQTTILEMGQPPAVQADEPAMWVRSRQYTGRIVTVPNSKVFDEPVYNYSREFGFIWEELSLTIPYGLDHGRAEQIVLDAARRHHVRVDEIDADDLKELQRRYFVVSLKDFEPRVFLRLTEGGLELTVRFVARPWGVRETKDAMTREILSEFGKSELSIAGATLEITGVPPLRWEAGGGAPRPTATAGADVRPPGEDGEGAS